MVHELVAPASTAFNCWFLPYMFMDTDKPEEALAGNRILLGWHCGGCAVSSAMYIASP